MKIELRSCPACPNVAQARRTLVAVLAELGLPPEFTEVVGEYPSPTVLVDGVDTMGGPVDGPASCRLDLPTAERVRTALRTAMVRGPAAGKGDPDARAECCESSADAVAADRSDRLARLPEALREVHRAILRHFATHGTAPGHVDLTEVAAAAGLDVAAAWDRLAREDLVAVSSSGRLIAAYPFSPAPTPHVVSLGRVEVYAMCAVDALGMPFMLGTDAVITSVDPQTGQPVQVTVTGGSAAFQPPEAVVVLAATGTAGPSVDTCCSTINFFTSTQTAHAWMQAHPGLTATVMDQDAAVALGRSIFEPLLA